MSWETFDEEKEGALRDTAPDMLSPIDENAPVSGHQSAPTATDPSQALAAEHDWQAAEAHIFPVLRPAGTPGTAYDILVNADHLLAWGVDADKLRETAMANLAAWSARAPWTDELSGARRLLSSDTGEGSDAARILLEDVRTHLAGECGGPARVLIAVPDRDLLVAGSLNPDDHEFATQFAAFVADVADDAHEPIDRGLFELVGDGNQLVRFPPGADAA